MFTSNWTQVVSRSFLKPFSLAVCVFGMGSIKRNRIVHLILLCCWLCWYISIWILTLYRTLAFLKECRLDCMLEHILFVSQTMSHAVIMIHIFLQRSNICRRQAALGSDLRVAYFVFALLMPILVVHCLVTYFKVSERSRMVFYWRSLPSTLGLQMQVIAFLTEIVEANHQAKSARCQLELLARPIPFYWRKPESMQECTNQLKTLKLRYGELYELFSELNLQYGESLLIIFIVFFLDFVSNAYWLFLDLTRDLHVIVFIEHFGFLFNIWLQLSVTCWHCQQSFNLGRQIGCLISKLIKPMGSKRYNNLVCEFSLQTLHQRFVITAKDFFSLNLHLLSSMFAAVVTYLVILIQFMFAESTLRVKDT